eukprot:gnl/TRDRNA2_/TRDRNA2_189054_c0_seq1.p1 gnl/TRDRNA2_/TRDRNA2_189054_c0~~gnl/TRDRNA2_/TRDRNA2_189054_c0_seq1.p1  ORF type:complete len:555 (+),score=101.87 gnl/TRDRNA2_/TRDRNA2_189054_c0_seq1:158-1822(+)
MAGVKYQPLVTTDGGENGSLRETNGTVVATTSGQSIASHRTLSRAAATEKTKGEKNFRTAWLAGKYVIDPHSSGCLPFWDMLLLILICLACLNEPYKLGFKSAKVQGFSVFESCQDVIFWMDIVLQFFIAYKDTVKKRWVKRPKAIVRNYICSIFWVDVLSCLPYQDIINALVELGEKENKFFDLLRFLSLLRIIRLFRIRRLMQRYEARVGIPYKWVALLKMIVILVLEMHWLACTFGLALHIEHWLGEETTWMAAVAGAKPDFYEQDAWELYTSAIYWSFYTSWTIGYGDITATNKFEAWFMIGAMGLSGMIQAYIIGLVCSIIGSLDCENTAFVVELDSLNVMMTNLDLPQHLRIELREYFHQRKTLYHRQKQVQILEEVSPALQGRVARCVHENLFQNIHMFSIASDAFVVGIFKLMIAKVYPPRELVKLPRSLVVLIEGVVLKGQSFVGVGATWGVEEILLEDTRLHEQQLPLCISFCELQYLTRVHLNGLLQDFPKERKFIRSTTIWLAVKRSVEWGVVHPSWDRRKSTANLQAVVVNQIEKNAHTDY